MTADLSEIDTVGQLKALGTEHYYPRHLDAETIKKHVLAMAETVRDKDPDDLTAEDIATLLDHREVISEPLWRIWWSILPREKNAEGEQ